MRRRSLTCLLAVLFTALCLGGPTDVSRAAEKVDWTGDWSTTYGPMKLKQVGSKVTGEYDYDADPSRIRATASGRTLTGVWDERPAACDTGPINWTMSEDGSSFSGTWGPGCGSGGTWNGTRVVPPARLTVTVRSAKSVANGFTEAADSTLVVTVKNTGSSPIEAVTVHNVPTVKTVKRSHLCGTPVDVSRQPLNAGQGTLAPGQTGSPAATFDVKHTCAGSADVTIMVTGRTAAGETLTARGTGRVVVPRDARIRGRVEVVPAWPGNSFYVKFPLGEASATRLLGGTTVLAKGPKRTFRARVSALTGTYEIKIPSNALGDYVLTTSAPKAHELHPVRTKVRARAGSTVVRNFEAGFDCDTKLPGVGFAVDEDASFSGTTNGKPNVLRAFYRCRSRSMLLVVNLFDGRYVTDADRIYYLTTCRRADGSTYEIESRYNFMPFLMEIGADGAFSDHYAGYGNMSVTALFSDASTVRATMDSTDCVEDANETLTR